MAELSVYPSIYVCIYISHDNFFKNRGSRNPPSRYPSDLKFFMPSVWTTSRIFAKFQVSISILTCFKRRLNMAVFAKSYFFCITALAGFGTKVRCVFPQTQASGLFKSLLTASGRCLRQRPSAGFKEGACSRSKKKKTVALASAGISLLKIHLMMLMKLVLFASGPSHRCK